MSSCRVSTQPRIILSILQTKLTHSGFADDAGHFDGIIRNYEAVRSAGIDLTEASVLRIQGAGFFKTSVFLPGKIPEIAQSLATFT